MNSRTDAPSRAELNEMLKSRTEDVVQFLFPNARKIGGHLCVGSIHGEAGSKFKIQTRGTKRGTFVDYGTSESDPNGKGDMVGLMIYALGGDPAEGFRRIREFLSLDTMDPHVLEQRKRQAQDAAQRAAARAAGDDERRLRGAVGMWQCAAEISAASPPVRYLTGRGIDFELLGRLPRCIRYRAKLSHAVRREKLPAMVTAFTALNGEHVATHRTYLEFTAKGWGKVPKMLIDGKWEDVAKSTYGLAWGRRAHIPLWKGRHRCKLADIPAGTPVYVSEGIEDGLSYAMADPQARVIAAGTLGMIGQVELPRQAGDLVILAQNDTKERPQQQLEEAIRQQQQWAREAGVDRVVRCKRPPPQVNDWNDWVNALIRDGA